VTLHCNFCGNEINPRLQTVWRQVTGWERKATSATRKGGSDIVLREPVDGKIACDGCIDSAKRGVAPLQESLI
jgi:hypothetical protein